MKLKRLFSNTNGAAFWQLLECVNDDQVTYYASGSRDLQPSEGDPSPLLTPDPLPDPAEEPLPLPPPTPTSAPTTDIVTAPLTTNVQVLTNLTAHCLVHVNEDTRLSLHWIFALQSNQSTTGNVKSRINLLLNNETLFKSTSLDNETLFKLLLIVVFID